MIRAPTLKCSTDGRRDGTKQVDGDSRQHRRYDESNEGGDQAGQGVLPRDAESDTAGERPSYGFEHQSAQSISSTPSHRLNSAISLPQYQGLLSPRESPLLYQITTANHSTKQVNLNHQRGFAHHFAYSDLVPHRVIRFRDSRLKQSSTDRVSLLFHFPPKGGGESYDGLSFSGRFIELLDGS